MMKTLIQWGTVTGLVGMVWLGYPNAGGNESLLPQAIAQTPEGQAQPSVQPDIQVLEKLQGIPVFVVADAQGGLVLQVVPRNSDSAQADPQEASISWVFVSQEDAKEFIERLNQGNPQVAEDARIVLMSLADIYQLAAENRNQPDSPVFKIVPTQQQLASAEAILEARGESVEQLTEVPLFVAKGGADGSFLVTERDSETVIPLFFSREDLQREVDLLSQENPELAGTIQIEVWSLERMIAGWENSDDPNLDRFVLVPLSESRELIRQLLQREAQSQQPQ